MDKQKVRPLDEERESRSLLSNAVVILHLILGTLPILLVVWAIITPSWMRHILNEHTLPRFVKYGINVFGIDASLPKKEIAEKAIDATYAFFESIGIPMHLRKVGIDESRIDEMARHIAVNEGLEHAYAPLNEQDIKEILVASL